MKKNSLVLLLLMLAGVVLGGFIGYLAKDVSWLSWLNYGQTFGITRRIPVKDNSADVDGSSLHPNGKFAISYPFCR